MSVATSFVEPRSESNQSPHQSVNSSFCKRFEPCEVTIYERELLIVSPTFDLTLARNSLIFGCMLFFIDEYDRTPTLGPDRTTAIVMQSDTLLHV